MRVVLDSNIVEIRAKKCEESRFTKTNTMDTMNWMSIMFREAAKSFENRGYPVHAKHATEAADVLYEKLNKYHYYDSVK